MSYAFEFDRFRLDPTRRQLFDTALDTPVQMAPRVFDTLLHLVENAGDVVTKSQLMDAVWPGVSVEENNICQNVSQLRRILGDDGLRRRFIVTAPGKGYRFVGGVAESAAVREPQAAGLNGALLHHERLTSLAVLPFVNLTGDSGNDYFCDGIAEEILDLLGSCSGLRLSARASSFAQKVREMPSEEAANALHVDAILEGSVRAAGKRLRISAHLVDGGDGYVLWSRSFDREIDDLFEVQAEVATAVVDALIQKVDRSISPLPPPPVRESRHIESYKSLLQAQWLGGKGTLSFVSAGIDLCEAAIARTPDFALAHARYAILLVYHCLMSAAPEMAVVEKAEGLARRALELNPDSVTARSALGALAGLRGRLLEADAYFRQVLPLRPTDVCACLGRSTFVSSASGRLQEALPPPALIDAITPFQATAAANFAMEFAFAGDNARAEKYAELTLEYGLPKTSLYYADVRALLYARQGRYDEAADTVAAAIDGLAQPKMLAAVKLAYRAIPDSRLRPKALKALAAVHEKGIADLDMITRKRLILLYGQLDQPDRAMALLSEVVRDLKARGLTGAGWGILWVDELRCIHCHPDFVPTARDLGFVEYWEAYGPPDGYRFDGTRLVRKTAR